MTYQQIIKLAAQAESEGNYRFADFLDRELIKTSQNFGSAWNKILGRTEEEALQAAQAAAMRSLGPAAAEGAIARGFSEATPEATQAALRSLETSAPKSGTMLQEATGMIFGKGNKIIERTVEELAQAEAKISQIIQRIATGKTSKEATDASIKRLEATLSQYSDKDPRYQLVQNKINELQKLTFGSEVPANVANKFLNGQPLTNEEMQLLYREILQADPSAFAGKSKMRPSDIFDFMVNKKITNPQTNKITGRLEKFMYAPNTKAGKWGTGLMAAGMGYAALNYGLPLLGAGVAGASAAGKAALNNMQGGNAGTAAQGGNVQGGSSTYGLGRDNASVGTNQYYANRAPSSTVASNKTKWIKTSDL